jgi:hypothetical protein
MPNDSVNIEKHIKTYMLNTCEITENAKLREKLKKKKTPQAVNSRAAYMREYRNRMQLEEDICNNVPKRTKYIYSNTNPNVIPFSTLILGTKVPESLFTDVIRLGSLKLSIVSSLIAMN